MYVCIYVIEVITLYYCITTHRQYVSNVPTATYIVTNKEIQVNTYCFITTILLAKCLIQ